MTLTPAPDPAALSQLQAQVRDLQRELAACRLREAEALRAARIDGLTGLPNRRLLEHQMAQLLDRAHAGSTMLALLFIDLNDFKAVNDLHGHSVGDALLRLIGLRLRHAMRRDDLACRIGGDEFVCVLEGLHAGDEVRTIEAKLQSTIGQACHLGELTLTVQPSIGTALFPRDGLTLSDLLAHADRTMYSRKQARTDAAAQALGLSTPSEPNTRSHQPWVTP
jgi:diguanylate cyclase (GGDEF)-like protein